MKFYDPKNRLKLSCFEASRAWFEEEKPLKEKIEKNPDIDQDEFAKFLKVWQLSRTFKLCKREPVLEGLIVLAEKYVTQAHVLDGSFIGDLDLFRRKRGTTGKPCSMVSKFLFCAKPLKFSPYDQYTRRALNSLGAKIAVADYAAFLGAFEQFHALVQKDISKEKLGYEAFTFGNKKFESNALFTRRVADKYLMLLGGFGDDRMVESVTKIKDKFPKETLEAYANALNPMG